MKRRILALMLCLVTLFTMLVGCGKKEVDEEELVKEQSVRSAVSINMWVVTEKEVSEETEALVEEALNKVTKSRFTTYVDLIFVTEDKYNAALDARFDAIKAAEDAILAEEERKKEEARSLKAAGITTVAETTLEETTVITEEATILNEYGVVELEYPEIPEAQIDVVCILGRERLEELVSMGYLTDLDDQISSTGTSKALTDYIHPSLFKFTKVDGSTYGIPNNHVIGEYTYLLVNKKMAEKYYIHEDEVKDMSDVLSLVEDIKENESIAPVKAPYDPYLTYFWGSDIESDGFSVLASRYPLSNKQDGTKGTSTAVNSKLAPTDVYSVGQYTEHMLLMKKYELGGYFAKTATEEFGVGIVMGDYALRFEYDDDYIVKAIRQPLATEDDVYQSFFGVSSFTGNLERSMEVITLLNTAPDIRNIIQYGVEGVHYELNDEGALVRLNNDYMLNINYTGNVFMAYPEEGMDLDAWTHGKLQNQESAAHVLLGIRSVWNEIDAELMKRIDALADGYKKRQDACKTVEELAQFFADAKLELAANEDIKRAKTSNDENITDNLAVVYTNWYQDGWPSVE